LAAWSSATAYAIGDLASYDGVNYYSIKAGTNHAPPNATYWYAMPEDGTYEIPSPFAIEDVPYLTYSQTEDIISFAHKDYPPYELRRYGATRWIFTQVSFRSTLNPPASVTATETIGSVIGITSIRKTNPCQVVTAGAHSLNTGDQVYLDGISGMTDLNDTFHTMTRVSVTVLSLNGVDSTAFPTYTGGGTVAGTTGAFKTYSYKVTAIGPDGKEESLPSAAATCSNNLLATGNKNTIAWSAVSGAIRYNVYSQDNGLYGLIGQTDQTSFVDDNFDPDLSKTPPIERVPFDTDFPGAVGYAQQRRIFASTTLYPSTFWLTRTGSDANLSYSIPSRADDGISYRLAARQAAVIRHIVALQSVILLTSSSVWNINSDGSAITPDNTVLQMQDSVGANHIPPIVAENNLVYVSSRGGHFRDIQSTIKKTGFGGGYVGSNLSIRAPHLVEGKEVVGLTFAEAPYPIIWAPMSDGSMVGVTYMPDQEVIAFHRHDTSTKYGQSVIGSACVIPEDGTDYLYMVVSRLFDRGIIHCIERMERRFFTGREDAFFVDCGLTYDGVAVSEVSGLDHLEGETVSIVADGAARPRKTVTAGAVSLDSPASVIHVGLPITAQAKTLPLMAQIEGYGQGRQKSITKAWLRLVQSSGITAGSTFGDLRTYRPRTTEPYGSPPSLKDSEVEISIPSSWNADGCLCIEQTEPLPVTITSLSMEVSVGG
jgi:hypothetical protein